MFQQENDKVAEIANDMKANGFDKSRPIIIKKFDSRDETIEYEYKMQLNSRRLTYGEYFAAFLKLDEIRRSNPNAQGSSDEAIGRQLNKSARQVCKMREIAKKADASLLEKIQNGSISINKAHEMIKAAEARKKGQILRDKRIAKLELGALNLSEEDVQRISQRFWVA